MVHVTCCEKHSETAAARAGARHSLLKAATSHAHADLDALVMRSGYFETQAAFRAYLLGMSYFYTALLAEHEATMAGAAPIANLRKHLEWLSQDIRRCGLTAPPIKTSATPAAEHDKRVSNSKFLGVMYVVCGSSKGAQVLQRICLTRNLPAEGGSVYLANIAKSGLWDRFLERLGEDECIDDRVMIEAALAMFADVRKHLGERAPNDDHG